FDLAAVRKVARDIGLFDVQRLALHQLREACTRFATHARLLLLGLLGPDPLLLLALRADGVGLGEIDVLLRARLAASRALRALSVATLVGSSRPGIPPRRRGVGLLPRLGIVPATTPGRIVALGGRSGLEPEAEQLVAEGVGHVVVRQVAQRALRPCQ